MCVKSWRRLDERRFPVGQPPIELTADGALLLLLTIVKLGTYNLSNPPMSQSYLVPRNKKGKAEFSAQPTEYLPPQKELGKSSVSGDKRTRMGT